MCRLGGSVRAQVGGTVSVGDEGVCTDGEDCECR